MRAVSSFHASWTVTAPCRLHAAHLTRIPLAAPGDPARAPPRGNASG
jgi:hypothetical protein